ncbi:phosphotransferase [Motilimonas sp. E26]|uniref:phosphotransferase n=1 Tax=Motilimonas sp. E26 TaxID=2865674 RepID=UPI001E5A7584|nr:phosphotransferase [Motilimonas sp. E26]
MSEGSLVLNALPLACVKQIHRLSQVGGPLADIQLSQALLLTQGVSHQSVRLIGINCAGEGIDWVLRLPPKSQVTPWLSDDNEAALLRQLAQRGLYPELIYSHGGVLISAFFAGIHLSPQDFALSANRAGYLQHLADALAQLNLISLPPALYAALPKLNLAKRCQQLYQSVLVFPGNICSASLHAMVGKLELLPAFASTELTLCHGDLHRHNILFSEQGLALLDWEYASIGNRLIDIAALAEDLQLSDAQAAVLIARCGCHMSQLALYRLGYRLLELLWYLQPENVASASDQLLAQQWRRLIQLDQVC